MSADPCEVRLQLAADGVEHRDCGRVARYLVWGEPCSCQAGEPTCPHIAAVRLCTGHADAQLLGRTQ